MRQDEFERQVQKKMDELILIPSNAVWKNIEPLIRKEKRRRWLWLFIPVLLAGLFYTIYLFQNTNSRSAQEITKSFSSNSDNTTGNEKTNKAVDSVQKGSVLHHETERFKNEEPVRPSFMKHPVTAAKKKIIGQLKINIQTVTDSEQKATVITPANNKENFTADSTVPDESSDNVSNRNSFVVKTVEQDKIMDSAVIGNDKNNRSKDSVELTANNFRDSSSTESKRKFSNHFHLGMSFSAGVSGMDLLIPPDKNIFADPSSNASNPSPGGTSRPSAIHPSIAFIAGITAEKNITNKLWLITGINYKMLHTTNNVGSDSSIFFRSDAAITKNHNYYHFLEFPLGIKLELATINRSAFYWHGAATISQLIGARALQYNYGTRFYFHDNSQFNKTQFGLNTGLDISFPSQRQRSFLTGILFNYSFSKMANTGFNKHHIMFLGLRTQYWF